MGNYSELYSLSLWGAVYNFDFFFFNVNLNFKNLLFGNEFKLTEILSKIKIMREMTLCS